MSELAAIFGPLKGISGAVNRVLASQSRRWLTYPIFAFVVTRLVMLVAVVLADLLLPRAYDLPYWQSGAGRWFFDYWARWDSTFYLGIADAGYFFMPGQQGAVAFFPLYPLLVAVLKVFTGSGLAAGVIVSNLSFLSALIFLYRLAEDELSSARLAGKTVFLLAAFPTAFIFSAVYAESTFLLFSVGTVYFARHRAWAWAALFGLLCTACRIVGVLVWGIVLLEWLSVHGWRFGAMHRRAAWAGAWRGLRSDTRSLLTICMIPVGLLSYMLFLWLKFGDPVAFWTTQRAWGRQMGEPLTIFSGAARNMLKIDLTMVNISYLDLLNLIAFAVGIAMAVAVWRKLGESFAIYTVFSLLIPASSGIGSMSRYILAVFPLFMMLSIWVQRVWLGRALAVGFGVFLGIFTAQFVNWVFIA